MSEVHRIQEERIVLRSMIYNEEHIEVAERIISADDFIYKPNGGIFLAILELKNLELPIEHNAILQKAKTYKFSESDLLEVLSITGVANIETYSHNIKEYSLKRKLMKLATQINEDYMFDKSSSEIIGMLESEIYNITTTKESSEFKVAQEVVTKTMLYIEDMKKKGNLTLIGIDTGFRDLNKQTTGFGEGDLIIVAARPAMGKTTLVLNMAQRALDTGKGVAFFSLEMPSEQLMLRMLAAKTKISLQNLRIGDLQDGELSMLSKAADEMSKAPLFIDDNSSLTINDLKSKLKRLKTKHPEVSIAIVDYLQLMISSDNKDRHQQVSDISRGLKTLARELKMPIIALSQLNRSLESRSDRRPMLSDLRESGAIEQDADIILFVYREAVYKAKDAKEREEALKKAGEFEKAKAVQQEQIQDNEEAEIIIGKQRNGPTGTIKLQFHKRFSKFEDIALDVREPHININTELIDMPSI
ncbi:MULTISPECIES: replicative DNA helicase [Helicobacter]|uniref:Replicative DNA helicase n=1 Tax=Helicobacter ibis TaxID=2962633 RepID=A0ABT4VEZ8_9HELI|nr:MULTISPECIES: replicative DNA helicase [Helicobacter]MDA3967149.1 replicative DNA helicase [Helicobacter sp. WB40]MDA3969277.1 replicative DNA helicase [Helicobacter ibis]